MAGRKRTEGKFYLTTPIYYVNDLPHIGHSYTTIVADIIARWQRQAGKDVYYLTGLDENSVNTVKGAAKYGYTDIQAYTDMMAAKWMAAWQALGIQYDGFIRTTETRHMEVVEKFFAAVYKNGDIYKGKYEGLYCENCEAFLVPADLADGKCALHKKEPKMLAEENYFFRLSKYQQQLLRHLEEHPDFVMPKERRNEVLSFVRSGLKDISISRPNIDWGIRLPADKSHVIWVWFDALINYISGAPDYWPADLHLMGKDIIRFHCVIWPCMLMAAGYELPKRVFAHGFFTIDGQKMSKTLGNVIDPVELAKKYPIDAIRYYLVREIPFGEDGDFSETMLKQRINGELVSDLGNLVYRVLTLAEKFDGSVEGKAELDAHLDIRKIDGHIERLEMNRALDAIWSFIRVTNRYINDKKPWKLSGPELSHVLYNLLESLRVCSILLYPFLPTTAESISAQLDLELGTFKDLKFGAFKGRIRKGRHLFEPMK
ncbi:MAG: methionine--tRNA ligase [Candidatus Aenigmarchaeota archaeon]|nr:methionine--tRNA ligase [Candidatus Aenigmarchaeota archaeon]